MAANAIPYSVGSIIALERTPNPTGDSGIENVDDAPGVKVGEEPVAIGVNPATNTIYVCNYKSNTVSVINGSNDKVVSVIPTVDKNPSQILVNSRTNMIYVYTQSDNGLTIINGSTNKVVGNLTNIVNDITSIDDPSPSLGISEETNKIYAVRFPNTIIQIDGKTNQVTNEITLEELLYPIDGISPIVSSDEFGDDKIYAFHSTIPGNYKVYLIEITTEYQDDNSATVFGKITATIPLHQQPLAMTFDPNRDLAYIVNTDRDTLSGLDVVTGLTIANVSVGKYPTAVEVDTSSNIIYVANKYNNTVSVVDGNK